MILLVLTIEFNNEILQRDHSILRDLLKAMRMLRPQTSQSMTKRESGVSFCGIALNASLLTSVA